MKPRIRPMGDGTFTVMRDGQTFGMRDTLANVISGMGSLDWKSNNTHYSGHVESFLELKRAYKTSWLAMACVDMPVDDALAGGRSWQGDTDQINQIEAEEKRLRLNRNIRRAKKLARRDGYAFIFIDTGSSTEEELVPGSGEKIRRLFVVPRLHIAYDQINQDPGENGFGRPELWSLTVKGRQIPVHPSRVCAYKGEEDLDTEEANLPEEYGSSSLGPRLKSIRDAEATFANVVELTYEASVDILSIQGLMDSMKTNPRAEENALRRVTLFKQAKAVGRLGIKDEKESFDRNAVNFGALPQILQEAFQIASGATRIPATRLLGRAPAGMSSTGDGDERVYFDFVDDVRDEIREESQNLDNVMIASLFGSLPDGLHYRWPPLRQVTDKEKAEILDKTATAWQKITVTGTFTPMEVRKTLSNTLIEQGLAPGLEEAMNDTQNEEDLFSDPVPGEEAEGDLETATGNGQGSSSNGPGGQASRDGSTQPPLAILDGTPRTMYVHRKVLNPNDIRQWAKEQGFDSTLEPDDLHVTVVFTRTQIDWLKMGQSWMDTIDVPAGGPRMMEQFGDAKVLVFASDEIQWRHERAKEIGAQVDYEEFNPHITISYKGDLDLTNVEPYQGRILLGPETFAEVIEDGNKQHPEVAL